MKDFNMGNTYRSVLPQKEGWYSGWYTCKCAHCRREYLGGKYSNECYVCAYDTSIHPKPIALLEE